MPGMNRKGTGGAGIMAGKGNGKCRQTGDAVEQGQVMGQRGGRGQGGCRRQQDGSQDQGRGGGSRGSQSADAGVASASPAAGYTAEKQRIEQKTDPNQQTLDEIMEAVQQMEMQSKGKK